MVGFIPDDVQLSAFTENRDDSLQSYTNGRFYRKCKNYSDLDICNWMVAHEDNEEYCQSCRLTRDIPNLANDHNVTLWFRMEQAKRRLLYTLLKLNLPVVDRIENPKSGMGFAFLKDEVEDEYGNELTIKNYVTTGHASGLITVNLDEAEHSTRMKIRDKMHEQYRTLIGHLRHESGHYYWDKLVKNSDKLNECRRLFGDERIDYKQAMQSYYDNGPKDNWQNVWISAYATMHPWEDWAETWAHYLHMVDTLESASAYDVSIMEHKLANPLIGSDYKDDVYTATSFTHLFNDWCRLTPVLNALNRSMGISDPYPFVISITALDKLRFVHELVIDTGSASNLN